MNYHAGYGIDGVCGGERKTKPLEGWGSGRSVIGGWSGRSTGRSGGRIEDVGDVWVGDDSTKCVAEYRVVRGIRRVWFCHLCGDFFEIGASDGFLLIER